MEYLALCMVEPIGKPWLLVMATPPLNRPHLDQWEPVHKMLHFSYIFTFLHTIYVQYSGQIYLVFEFYFLTHFSIAQNLAGSEWAGHLVKMSNEEMPKKRFMKD